MQLSMFLYLPKYHNLRTSQATLIIPLRAALCVGPGHGGSHDLAWSGRSVGSGRVRSGLIGRSGRVGSGGVRYSGRVVSDHNPTQSSG